MRADATTITQDSNLQQLEATTTMTFKTSCHRTAEIDAASKGQEDLLEGITSPGLNGM
jgi:hypothetical protein